jgi:hypothetical protein
LRKSMIFAESGHPAILQWLSSNLSIGNAFTDQTSACKYAFS